MTTKRSTTSSPTAQRKITRDNRIAALSLSQVQSDKQRASRVLSQTLLAAEIHDAIALCVKSNLLMPVAALLRSLIDTTVLAIWILKYATDEEAKASVAHLSTSEMVKNSFDSEDRPYFAFIFESVKNTDNEFYGDVLHPSIHGDALHIMMRVRNEASRRVWVRKCLFHAQQVYVHMLLQFAKSGKIPQSDREDIQRQSAAAIRLMTTLLRHPDWSETEEQLSE